MPPPRERMPVGSMTTVPLLTLAVAPPPLLWLVGPAISTVPPGPFVRFTCKVRVPPPPLTVFRWPALVTLTPTQQRLLLPLLASPMVRTPVVLIVLAALRLSWAPVAGMTSVCVLLGPPPPSVSERTE